MQRLALILVLWLALLSNSAKAGSFALTDGSRVVGDPESYKDGGVTILKSDGIRQEFAWGRFTSEALQQLHDDPSATAIGKAFVEPFIIDIPSERTASREIVVKPIETPDRPVGHLGLTAIFASPMGWVMLLVLYGANLFAAYEVAIFRNQPVFTVCGLAAIPLIGVGTSLYYLAQPTRALREEDSEDSGALESSSAPIPLAAGNSRATPGQSAAPAAGAGGANPPEGSAPAQGALPPPVVYQRGDFSFNRRFFETKLPGFFRVVLSEADKNMVILIKSSRGDFVGKRIPRITQTELYLQVFKDGASSEEMIPFAEVLEVQVRHKDLE